jgi:hypothetical protein
VVLVEMIRVMGCLLYKRHTGVREARELVQQSIRPIWIGPQNMRGGWMDVILNELRNRIIDEILITHLRREEGNH